MSQRVLIVDDEVAVREHFVSILQDEGFEASAIESGEFILETLNSFRPQVILLDYNIPGKNGIEVIQMVRSFDSYYHIPIIMVSGTDGDPEKVAALDLGADDYVVKPVSGAELSARIRAVLRRSANEANQGSSVLSVSGINIDCRTHKVTVDQQEVLLTLTEFKILCELLKGQGNVLSRDQLRELALGKINVSDRTIDVHMASLRKKIGKYSDGIRTVRGVGYRFQDS